MQHDSLSTIFTIIFAVAFVMIIRRRLEAGKSVPGIPAALAQSLGAKAPAKKEDAKTVYQKDSNGLIDKLNDLREQFYKKRRAEGAEKAEIFAQWNPVSDMLAFALEAALKGKFDEALPELVRAVAGAEALAGPLAAVEAEAA